MAILEKINLYKHDFAPYGGSLAVNVLETFLGTPDIITNVGYNHG